MEDKKYPEGIVKYFLIIFSILTILTSCVPNRKITYLQYKDELSQLKTVPIDTVVREYQNVTYEYRLQADDQVMIMISTPTPDEYNPYSLADRNMAGGGTINTGQSSLMGYRVDPDGYLNLPIIGPLKAAGMTIYELEDTLTVLASKDLEEPVTKVNLLNFRYTIIGEANGIGTQRISEYSISLIQALVGGPQEYGDLSRIKVIRKINNKSYVFYVNLLDENFLTSEFYFVHPNDIIIVTPMKRRILMQNVPQTLGFIASTLSLVLTLFTLISINK
jgi:polysaccharide export outer membrane protein